MTRLEYLRNAAGLSQHELAEKIGMTQQRISAYELGKREPDLDTLKLFADFFDVSVDFLLGRVTNTISDTDFHVGLSKSEEGTLTEEEKEEIKNFAKFVMSKRGK